MSTSRALQVAAKRMMLNTIVYSKPMIARSVEFTDTVTLNVPNILTLHEKSIKELKNLKFEKVEWSS